jgi:hypothetical protein
MPKAHACIKFPTDLDVATPIFYLFFYIQVRNKNNSAIDKKNTSWRTIENLPKSDLSVVLHKDYWFKSLSMLQYNPDYRREKIEVEG